VRGFFAAFALVACFAGFCSSASAATVDASRHLEPYVGKGDADPYPVSEFTFSAAPGETNDLSISADRDGTVNVTDNGASLTASGLCESVSEHVVRCPRLKDLDSARVDLGDGSDRAVAPFFLIGGEGDDDLTETRSGAVDGGPGDDHLTAKGPGTVNGGPGDDTIIGSDAYDTITAGAGRDVVQAGDGNDRVIDGSPEPCGEEDDLDGGGGFDSLSYEGRECAVSVNLALTRPGLVDPGVGDRFRSFEGVVGGNGDDDLRAAPGGSEFNGGPGNDVLTGGDGNDSLIGGGRGGHDFITGGAGNDSVAGGDGSHIDGGPGNDYLGGTSNGAETLIGGDGNDKISGNGGADVVDAGAGDDEVWSYLTDSYGTVRRAVKSLDCGRGNDKVRMEWYDLALGCEVLSGRDADLTVIRLSHTGLKLRVRCPAGAVSDCRTRIAVRDRATRELLALFTGNAHPYLPIGGQLTFSHPVPNDAVLRIDVRQRWIMGLTSEPNQDTHGSIRIRLSP
jgi:Ca2+-binding RTX toxin-like protein